MNKRRKQQPTAECYREQLALAADVIIDLRSQVARPVIRYNFAPPPSPPPERIEHSTPFGRLMFESESAFNDWKALPWWRRIFRKS